MSLLLSVLEQGMIYAIMALGVYITYKILDFPDLTVDGSFPMGAAITCILISKGMNPILTLFISFAAGVLVGILTGVIHVKLKVRDLLSGIIMMTALYTVNLRIAGRANLPIYNNETIFDNALVNGIFPEALHPYQTVIIILILTILVKYLLDAYLRTKSGFLLRAVGDNDMIVTSLGDGQGSGKDRRTGHCKWSGFFRWLCLRSTAKILRRFHGNRYGGHRSCQRNHRHQLIQKSYLYTGDKQCSDRLHHL